jgi:replication-associated recombination protein RarA
MIPPTKNGLPSMAVLSAMQKAIRRGMERLAMECAVELMHTSKAFNTMVCNRLEIVSHEDIDTEARPDIVPFVHAACEQAKDWWVSDNPGKSRMAVGNAIRMMCRAPKSREGDHFQAAIGLRSLLAGFVPEIPDWAFDGHTMKGKRMGRGVDFFRQESTKLVPAVQHEDQYIDEAYRMWALKDEKKKSGELV